MRTALVTGSARFIGHFICKRLIDSGFRMIGVEANLLGAYELLEAARAYPPQHLLMASTSSIYGANTQTPYKETDKVDTQMSFYAATKKASEAMAHSYAHLYGVPTTMFRFFTVYGP